jgi:hypothetical protein
MVVEDNRTGEAAGNGRAGQTFPKWNHDRLGGDETGDGGGLLVTDRLKRCVMMM